MIAYTINAEGRAGGRLVSKDYVAQGDEQLMAGNDLSALRQLNTEAYGKKVNKKATEAIAEAKISAIMPSSKIAKLVRKEAKGNASGGDIEKLDVVDAIQDASDLINDEIDIDVNYDYINSPLWP